MHWATAYIGRDYFEVGLCWGLVQTLCRARLSFEMPDVPIGSRDDQTVALKRAVGSMGWRRVACAVPEPDDLVVMESVDGRHVGFAVEADGQVGVLHAKGTPSRGGEVVFDTMTDLVRGGFHTFEFWRCT